MKETSPEKNESLSPRTRETSSDSPTRREPSRGEPDQLNEDRFVLGEESDPPIVVRDGKTDHTAKRWADRQSGHSTHARETNVPTRSVSSALTALNRKAEKEPKYRFRDLYRLLDLQALYESFGSLKRSAAPGVDGVTWNDYEANLDENLHRLLDRLKAKRYRAPHVKRSYIPKGDGKMRPLGLPTLEDKIVQHAASRILEHIYEADFSDRSLGYRRGKPGAREISQQLTQELKYGTYRWVVEADIRSFFDEVDHDWLVKMLEQRIDDRAFIGLVCKWLKAGVLDPQSNANQIEQPEAGTPQGGIISPMLANIYLHYVLDLWIEKRVSKESDGEVIFMRYADDLIVGFEKGSDAKQYLAQLPKRLEKFNLRLAEEKSSLVKFNRWEPEDSGKFTFLGYDFYWSPTKKNPKRRVVKRKTNKKKYRTSLRAMKEWIEEARSWPLRMILSSLRRRLRGYWNYYCVIANSKMTWRYMRAVCELMFKWLNRRSQRKSYTWAKFMRLWNGDWKIPRPQVVEKWGGQHHYQSEMPLAENA
jgi:group II intron reverse transcriptase/maturase